MLRGDKAGPRATGYMCMWIWSRTTWVQILALPQFCKLFFIFTQSEFPTWQWWQLSLIVSLEVDFQENERDGGYFLSPGTGDRRRADASVPLAWILEPATSPSIHPRLSFYIPGNKPSAFPKLARQMLFKASVPLQYSSICLICHFCTRLPTFSSFKTQL